MCPLASDAAARTILCPLACISCYRLACRWTLAAGADASTRLATNACLRGSSVAMGKRKAAPEDVRVLKPAKRSRKAREAAAVPSPAELRSRAAKTDTDWRRAPGTTKGYSQIIKQLRTFRDALPVIEGDPETDYADALDVVSAKSPELLLLFMAYLVDDVGNGKSRINSVNAAVRDHFARLGCQVRAASCDPLTPRPGRVLARTRRWHLRGAADVRKYLRELRQGGEETGRTHGDHQTCERAALAAGRTDPDPQSRPMKLKELVKIVLFIDARLIQPGVPAVERMQSEWFRGYLILAWHLFARSATALAVLEADACHRTSELRELRTKEVKFGLKSDHGKPHVNVTLTWRKTNHDDPTKGASTSARGPRS
jgi:hypothetical protein